MSDFLTLLDWIAALLFAGALAMMALSEREIRAARTAVHLAAAAFTLRWVVWGINTDQPLLTRILVGAVAGSFMVGIFPLSIRWLNERYPRPFEPGDGLTNLNIQPKGILDKSISVECNNSSLPNKAREGRRLYSYQIHNPGGALSVATTFQGPGDHQLFWDKAVFGSEGIRCQIINYGKEALVGAFIKFKITWFEVEKTGSGIASGSIFQIETIQSHQFDLGAVGQNNEEFFFFLNISDYIVTVEPMDVINGTIVGSEQQSEIPTIESPYGSVIYSVLFPINKKIPLPFQSR